MSKNQIIILVVVLVLAIVLIIGLSVSPAEKVPVEKEPSSKEKQEEPIEEVFSLSAVVLSISAENNFLMVKPANQDKEVKVVISEMTKLIKLEFPFDPKNPPEGANFTPIQTNVEISDFREGDSIFIKTKENIAGKTEFDNVDFIHILP